LNIQSQLFWLFEAEFDMFWPENQNCDWLTRLMKVILLGRISLLYICQAEPGSTVQVYNRTAEQLIQA
jgi:hypothetical protein